ncbi:FAD binding domain-containing protein [Xanthobacter autotrophicus]|uniref:FAD binding domain-containing protein n=1 Tax=Xanthobacter autotrophicus TaxID=280 RepID=UPI0024A6C23C|nr:FAD binding domain-containing protein [Xanthobacter autotrophicus]MDI4656803.1 FAD binding domain-containing protein [Xanthobacter autotrophicus]
MKPAPFRLERPRDIAGATLLLAAGGEGAKAMAGAQSLGPMLNLRLATPELIVDLTGIDALRTAREEPGHMVYGALITHADVEDGRVPDVGTHILRRVAAGIAYRAVRNRGTMGGSLAHADPAADWVNALSALGAEVEIAGPAGTRRLAMGAFLTGALSTALEAGEILVAVRVPKVPATARFGYVKHCRKVGEFAHAIGAVLVDPAAGTCRALMGAIDAPPLVLPNAAMLFGGRIDAGFATRFDAPAADAALTAAGMDDAVDRHVHVEMLRRAAVQAAGLFTETRSAA